MQAYSSTTSRAFRIRFILKLRIAYQRMGSSKYLTVYHKYDLCWHIRDCLAVERNFLDTLFYKQVTGIWFLKTACRDQRNHPKIDSWLRAGSRHIRIDAASLCIVHVYHLKIIFNFIFNKYKYLINTFCGHLSRPKPMYITL